MKKVKLAAAVLLLGALVLFLLQNLGMDEVRFLVWKTELPLAIPILGAFFIGGVAARPLLRFLNGQRRERKNDKAAAKASAKASAKAAAETVEKTAAEKTESDVADLVREKLGS